MKKRVFFHYNKHTHRMTVHFQKQCIPVEHIDCRVPVETKYRKIQPYLVMQGFAQSVIIENNKAIIQ